MPPTPQDDPEVEAATRMIAAKFEDLVDRIPIVARLESRDPGTYGLLKSVFALGYFQGLNDGMRD